MIGRFLRGHTSAAITAASVILVAAIVAVIAVVSTGYPEQKLQLDDASVWVTNGSRQVIGRANTAVLELNTVVASDGSDLDVLQRGDTVLTHDRTSNTVQLVDAASSTVTATVPLPVGGPDVYLVDGFVVIHSADTGDVWIVREADLDSFDDGVEPDLTLEQGSVVAVDDAGTLVGFNRQAGRLVTMNVRSGGDPTAVDVPDFVASGSDELQITSVNGTAALLDTATDRLRVADHTIDLGERLAGAEAIRLAAPSATGSSVLVAYTGGLLGVDVATGSVDDLVSGRSGMPAVPVSDAGCAFAAWSDGAAWQRCGASDAVQSTLAQVSATDDDLVFRSNGRYVVLNDRSGGRVWAVQHENRLIDNWDQLIENEDTAKQDSAQDDSTPPVLEKEQQPPVAVDDEFGARPGRASVLPVLLNDYDPNGDVLVITGVTEIPLQQGSLDLISSAQQLQITLTPEASGTVSFEYTVSDGRGGSATAAVTVTVRSPVENSPPVQARPTRASVAAGGTFSANVLGDWYDPDGDPIYLLEAQVAEPDRVSFAPGGAIGYHDKGVDAATKEIVLVASDFSEQGTGSVTVTVGNPGEVPLIADGFVVQGYTGQAIDIAPLVNVHGGTGSVRLSSVAEYPDIVTSPNYTKGTFTVTSAKAGTFYVSYSVTDSAQQTGTGVVRVDVSPVPDASTRPITVPTVAFLYHQQTDLIDVLATDIDPAGGVLSIAGVDGVPQSSGAVVEILDHRILRVRLNNVLTDPLVFDYTVTNGLSSATGRVTVFQIPEPTRLQAPVAVPDAVSVRVGEVVDIPVIANDEHPNRKPLVVNPDLVRDVPQGGGLLFVSGNVLRYLAPNEPGDFTAVYRLDTTADVQFDTATVTITVREADADSNLPPAPPTLSARVLAGETVKIPIPLNGMDTDGDSVRLVGAGSNPQQGNVTVGIDSLSYTAGSAAQGTDSFTYEVVDSLGARAVGTVRVGISPSLATASAPVAMDDIIVTTPGKPVTVRVLANDSDPNASVLTVVGVEPTDLTISVTFDKDRVTFASPEAEGDYGVIYTIRNAQGQWASAWLRVRVDAQAPPVRPEVDDTVLSLTDILDHDTVTVDVLRSVFFAEGDVSDLTVSLIPGYDATAAVQKNGRIQVRVTQKSQIVPFRVARSDDPRVGAQAFIWVPGLDDALPELRKNAPSLEVLSGDTLSIDINSYVVAAGGKKVRLTDAATVKASNSNGDDLVSNPTALRFTSKDGYWGPASLSFEVTDGSSASDARGKKAVIVLAITVKPRDNQPPVFTGAQVSLQPGDERVLELRDLTKYPYPDDLDQLIFAINSQPSAGFTASLAGTKLTVKTPEDTKVGSTSEFSVGVRDAKNEGKTGVVKLSVVTSNRPFVSPTADTLTIRRGASESIQVLENDQGTNPFPGKPLTVVTVRGATPAGVQVAPSADKSTLTVTVDKKVDLSAAGQVTLQYQVADATNDPGRFTWGTVTITIVDVPDQPLAPVLSGSGFVNGQLSVSAVPLPYPNGAPITSFLIKSDDNGGYSKDCGASATCLLTDLKQGLDYQFYAVAVNQYGQSAQSALSRPMRSDSIPAAPTGVTVTPVAANAQQSNPYQVLVTWDPVPNPSPGSAVRSVNLSVNGVTRVLPPSTTSFTITDSASTFYSVEVWAENGADKLYPNPGQILWRHSAPVTATSIGPPLPASAAIARVGDTNSTVSLTWNPVLVNGGSVVHYRVERVQGTGAAPACSLSTSRGEPSGPSFSDGTAQIGLSYTYIVYASNGWGCSAFASNTVRVLVTPPPPTVALEYYPLGSGIYGARVSAISQQDRLPNTAEADYSFESGGNAVTVGYPLGSAAKGSFRSCIGDDIAKRCSATVDAGLPPVNANARVSSCTVGGDVSQTVSVPGAPSVSEWTYRYAFDIGTGFPPIFGDSSTVPPPLPGKKVRVAVQTLSHDGQFTSGSSPQAVFQAGSGASCT